MTIAVIGSGPAGSAAAHSLAINGHDVIIFERQEAVGGRTRSFRKNGFTLDTGAAFITNFYPRLMSLAWDLDFIEEIDDMQRVTGLYHNGHLTTIDVSSPLSFISFPLLSMVDKLKMAWWMTKMTTQRKKLDLADPATLSAIDHQSIADFARETLTENIYQTLVRPGIEPFWYFSCEDVSKGLLHALSAHAAGSKFYSFTNGIDTVCRNLTENVKLHFNTEVHSIEEQGSGYRVHFRKANQDDTLYVEQVIVATTASVAYQLTASLSDNSLSTFQRSFLESQEYVANVHACFEINRLEKPPKMSAIFPSGPGEHTLAALSFHRAKLPPNNHSTELISIFLSDLGAQRLMALSDEELYEECWLLARDVYPTLPKEYQPFHLIRRREAIPVHAVGRYTMADKFNREQEGKSLRFCGDYLATATIEGAIASGWRAAI